MSSREVRSSTPNESFGSAESTATTGLASGSEKCRTTSDSSKFSTWSPGRLTIRRYCYVFAASFVGYIAVLIILGTNTSIVVRSMALFPLPWLLVGGLVLLPRHRQGDQTVDNSQS